MFYKHYGTLRSCANLRIYCSVDIFTASSSLFFTKLIMR